jgi:hypothetical protein
MAFGGETHFAISARPRDHAARLRRNRKLLYAGEKLVFSQQSIGGLNEFLVLDKGEHIIRYTSMT